MGALIRPTTTPKPAAVRTLMMLVMPEFIC
jgi:hypothetical protein